MRERFSKIFSSLFYGFYKRPRAIKLWRGGRSLQNKIALLLIIAGLFSGSATYAALASIPPFGNDPDTVIWLLNLDLIILLLLMILIAIRIVGLWSGRRRGIAGSKLHIRLVLIFSFLAATPAIVMTIFSAFFLNFGIQSWFSEKVSSAITMSQAVAEAYLEEHQQVIKADALAMANDINRQADFLEISPEAFDKVIQTQSLLRNLSEAVVFNKSGRVLASSGFTFTLAFETLPNYAINRAEQGDVMVMTGESDNRVRALLKLSGLNNSFLYVGRLIDPDVLGNVIDTKEVAQSYEKLESHRASLLLSFTMIFFVVALILLLGAIWFGLIFSRQFIVPISSLISAADRVSGGDLSARVPAFDRQDEFDQLATAFNRMTTQLEEQRHELVSANRQLDERRRFTEAVLAGVSSGIIGVDEHNKVSIINNTASNLFEKNADDILGRSIFKMLPDLEELLEKAALKPEKITQAEINFNNTKTGKRIFLVRIAIEKIGKEDRGAVLTFDDITELQSAQRKAAWADVARRIAHEIKNPLTPIQLSAERLKKKYLSQIETDPETFARCTDTIIHHVGDIGRMVNEFSAFARMPEPVMQTANIDRLLKEIMAFQQEANSTIKCSYKNNIKSTVLHELIMDSQQIRQAVTNILQNAVDSIHMRAKEECISITKSSPYIGHINVRLEANPSTTSIALIIEDDGLGLPQGDEKNNITEPYITHKEKGTGLGLAIVKKIMEDHAGELLLQAPDWLEESPKERGATISLILPHAKNENLNSEDKV